MRAALRMKNLRFATRVRHQSLQNTAFFLLVTGVAFQNVPALAGISVFETFFLIAALLLILGLVATSGRMRFQPNPVTSWFLFTLVAFALPAIITETPRTLLTMTFALSSGVLALMASDAEPRAAARGALLSGFVLAFTAIGQRYGVVPIFDFSRVSSFRDFIFSGYTGLIPTRGSFGIVLMTSLTFLLASLMETRSRSIRTVALGGIAMTGLAAVVSLSRSTILAYLVALTSFAIFHLSSKRLRGGGAKRFRSAYIVLLGLAILASWLFLSGLVTELILRLTAIRPGSIETRLVTISEALEQVPEAWLLGTGSELNERLSHLVHNAYVAVLVERGVFGFTGFSMLNLTAFFVLLSRLFTTRPDRRHVYSCLLAGFLGVQTELMFFRGYLSIPYWVFMAILLIFVNQSTIPRRGASNRFPGTANNATAPL
jgi:hypothetical protein